jgi:uncharacterized SAM-binding protein YcdF (DUF218 family)
MEADWFTLRKLLTALLLPPGGPLLLIAFGLLLCGGRRAPLGRAIAGIGLIAAYLLSTNAIGSQLMRLVERDLQPWSPTLVAPPRDGRAEPPRAIVVLGGGLERERRGEVLRDRMSSRTLERVLHAARLARATGLPVLVSGGRVAPHRTTEADLMRRALEDDFGVRVRWVEQVSRDTAENAAKTAEVLRADRITRVILVTHAYHMRRAAQAFEAAGIGVVAAPGHFASDAAGDHWRDWVPSVPGITVNAHAARELVAYAWYRLSGRS